MARSTTEIYNDLLAKKEATPELAGLTSTSKVAIWRLWLWIVAYATYILESLWDTKAKELEQKAANTLVGTISWYAQKCREWQYGFLLEWIDNVYTYRIDDDNAKLAKWVAISEVEGGIWIKVAKDDGNGNPTPLTTSELNDLRAYMHQLKMVGTRVTIVSLDADKLAFDIDVYYYGNYAVVKDNVINAIVGYLQNLPFDGALSRANLITVINEVAAVEDVYINTLTAQYGNNPAAAIDRIAVPYSGYWRLDGGNDFANETIAADSITLSNGGSCTIRFKLYK
jgi:hypothetical protein